MSVFCRNLNFRRCTSCAATFVMMLAVGGVFVARAQAQQPPYALFERSTLTASGNTINAIQVPVVLASGITVYLNLSLQFLVDSTGNLTLASGYPQVTPSPILLTGSFVAGKYAEPSNNKYTINVAGPGVLDGGLTQWTGAGSCGFTATWYTGPIASNPLAARLSKAGITSTAWSYGIGAVCGLFPVNVGLIGVSQVGNTLTFVSFTNGGDSNLPIGQITYTLVP